MSNYIIKPQSITQDKRLTPVEQDYLCLIAQLQKANGCTASNGWFAEYFGVSRMAAVMVIKSLKAKGFIETQMKYQGKQVKQRTIKIIDVNSKQYLLSDSKQSLTGVVSNPYFDSKQYYKDKLKGKIKSKKTNFRSASTYEGNDCTIIKDPEEYERFALDRIKELGL